MPGQSKYHCFSSWVKKLRLLFISSPFSQNGFLSDWIISLQIEKATELSRLDPERPKPLTYNLVPNWHEYLANKASPVETSHLIFETTCCNSCLSAMRCVLYFFKRAWRKSFIFVAIQTRHWRRSLLASKTKLLKYTRFLLFCPVKLVDFYIFPLYAWTTGFQSTFTFCIARNFTCQMVGCCLHTSTKEETHQVLQLKTEVSDSCPWN